MAIGEMPLDTLNEEQAEAVVREMLRIRHGLGGFIYFCKNYVLIEDKVTGKAIPMDLFDCQREVAKSLMAGEWLIILKARQLGMTWLMAAYCLWCMICKPLWEGAVMNQDATYAMDFLGRVRFMHERLPNWLRPKMTTDQKEKIRFEEYGHGTKLRSLAATAKACRSVTGNLILCDEAAYIELLHEVRSGAEPSIAAGGVFVIMSTSRGPSGAFFDTWNASPNNRYKQMFFPWWARPGRTQEWYETELAAAGNDDAGRVKVKREYPATPDEAWDTALGRIFPTYNPNIHERTIGELGFVRLENDWEYYRAIDWGGTDPFVCIFATVIPEKTGFSIDQTDKGNREGIREIRGYRWKEERVPESSNNHFIDALRYLVTSTRLAGHLHIYKTIYIRNPAERYDIIDLVKMVRQESGNKQFMASFADRSRRDSIKTFNDHGVSVKRYKAITNKQGAILHGIDVVNTMLRGVNALHVRAMPDKMKEKYDSLVREQATVSMRELFFMEQHRLQNTRERELVHPILGTDF